MPARRVSLRPTVFHLIAKKPAKRETLIEYVVLCMGITTNLIFVIGCILFFDYFPRWANDAGLWLFLIASLQSAALSVYVMWEHYAARDAVEGGARDEFLEHCLYTGSGVLFAVGSVLWFPDLYHQHKLNVFIGHATSAWCFIWGSLGLVLASVWNAFGLVEESTKRGQTPSQTEVLCRRLASIALCCTAVGGALFVAGSFMFRPAFENTCSKDVVKPEMRRWKHFGDQHGLLNPGLHDPRLADSSELRMAEMCVSIVNQGTWVYLWGCVLFLAQSVISLIVSIIMNRSANGPRLEDLKLSGGRRTLQPRMFQNRAAQTEDVEQSAGATAEAARPA